MTRRSVVLPEPLGPRIVSSSPARTESPTSSSASTGPKDLLTLAISSSAGTSGFQHPGIPAFDRLSAVLGPPSVADPELLGEIIRRGRQRRQHLRVGVLACLGIEPRVA